jgi:hypothetical protein
LGTSTIQISDCGNRVSELMGGGDGGLLTAVVRAVVILRTRHEEVIRGGYEPRAGLLIERVKRRVVRDRGGRRLGRGHGVVPFWGHGLGSGFRSSAGSVFWRNGCRVRR